MRDASNYQNYIQHNGWGRAKVARTGDNMLQWDLRESSNCPCGHPDQSLDHIQYLCPLTSRVSDEDLREASDRARRWIQVWREHYDDEWIIVYSQLFSLYFHEFSVDVYRDKKSCHGKKYCFENIQRNIEMSNYISKWIF